LAASAREDATKLSTGDRKAEGVFVSFMGEISDIGAADLLYLLGLKQQSGHLAIRANSDEVVISLVRGRLTSVASSDPALRLGRMLVRFGHLTPDGLRRVLQLQEQSGGDPLGKVLLDRGVLNQEQLARCVEEQCIEILSKVIAAESGSFVFSPGETMAPANHIPLNADRIMLEATRRTDELLNLRSMLPDSETPLMIGPDLDALADTLSDAEVFIAATLQTAPATFNEIAARLSMEPATLWSTIIGMRQRGLLIDVRPSPG
jgi:hypothetical protein